MCLGNRGGISQCDILYMQQCVLLLLTIFSPNMNKSYHGEVIAISSFWLIIFTPCWQICMILKCFRTIWNSILILLIFSNVLCHEKLPHLPRHTTCFKLICPCNKEDRQWETFWHFWRKNAYAVNQFEMRRWEEYISPGQANGSHHHTLCCIPSHISVIIP